MTYAAGTHVSPGIPEREYVGWEPSDLRPHARIFENERKPEVYYGYEPTDLRPENRMLQPHGPGMQYGLAVPLSAKTLAPVHPHGEFKKLQNKKPILMPGPFEPFPKSTICSLRPM